VTEPLPTSSLQLRSLVTEQGTLELSLVDVPLPSLASDEVLVRVEGAPINPSDLGLLLAGADVASAVVEGTSERPVVVAPLVDGALRSLAARVGKSLPVGNEGAGTVVARDPPQRRSRSLDGPSRSPEARCIRSTEW
jgi:NADPH2:quinone reductase